MMAEENEKTEDTEQEAEEASAEATPEEPEAQEEVAEETPPEEAEDSAAEAEPDPAEPEAGAEDLAGNDDELTPKQRRRLERSRASGPPGPLLSPEERAARRGEGRRRAAGQRGRHRRRLRERRGEPGTGTPAAERVPGKRKVRLGKVVSSGAAKTITVRIERARRDPTYEKVVRRSSTVHAHDEGNEASEGDVVRVVETRPLSRTKRWRLLEIVERAR